jgi:tRNA(Leu) C34 or U34 (ribose-2'-O)-methylase TrmL
MSRDRCLYFSARATRPLSEAQFRSNSVLVFGNETDGMPDRILEKHPDECFTIPMQSGKVRSLNLATAAGIVLYEGLRQVGAKDAAKLASEFVAEKPEGDATTEPKARAGGSPRPRRRRRG